MEDAQVGRERSGWPPSVPLSPAPAPGPAARFHLWRRLSLARRQLALPAGSSTSAGARLPTSFLLRPSSPQASSSRISSPPRIRCVGFGIICQFCGHRRVRRQRQRQHACSTQLDSGGVDRLDESCNVGRSSRLSPPAHRDLTVQASSVRRRH